MKSILIPLLILAIISTIEGKIYNLTDLDNTLSTEKLFSDLYNRSVEWGVYKPDLYYGIKNRQDKPLSAGMMWYYENKTNSSINVNYRYISDQGVVGYYDFNDLSSASRQILNDSNTNTIFKTEFYKELEESDTVTGDFTSRWTVKVTIKKQDSTKDLLSYPLFFIAKEGALSTEDGFFNVTQNDKKTFFKAIEKVNGTVYEMIEIGSDTQINDKSWLGLETSEDDAWRLDTLWQNNYTVLKDASGLINTTKPNVILVRPQQTVDGWTLIMRYSKKNFTSESDAQAYSEVMNEPYAETVKYFDGNLSIAEGAFNAKFSRVFGEQGFTDFEKNLTNIRKFGKEVLSNLLGGVGYFYGPIRIKNQSDVTGKSWYYDDPRGLFTHTPSRPHFPRGFLWDEGFHTQLTCQWQLMMCLDVITHWFNTMKGNGWIPREQMRGKEAEINLDWELAEDIKEGNPPAFMFILEHLLQQTVSNKDERINDFFEYLYPRLETWFDFYNSSLANSISKNLAGTYMWKDVGSAGSLGSGLDDYPRGYRVSQVANVHQDLMGWMFTFSRFMKRTIDYLEQITGKQVSKRPSSDYWKLSNKIFDQTYNWCWDEGSGMLSDRILYDESLYLLEQTLEQQLNYNEARFLYEESPNPQEIKQRLKSSQATYSRVSDFSGHKGIVNMFPIAFGIFNDNTLLDNTLRFGADASEMFSPYGLRGISMKDEQYKPETGYWRGPIWISVNYLVLRGVYKFHLDYVPEYPLRDDKTMVTAKDFYLQLRNNIVNVVYNNWKDEHLIYENFNDATGKGQFAHPFTGWSTLVLLILSEKYI